VDLSVRGVIGYYLAGDYRLDRKVAVKKTPLERAVAGLLTNCLPRWSDSDIAVDDNGDWAPELLVAVGQTSGRSSIARSRRSSTWGPRLRRRCSSWASMMSTCLEARPSWCCIAGFERLASPPCTWSSRGPTGRRDQVLEQLFAGTFAPLPGLLESRPR
jgi:hypothetical protein